MSFALVFGFLLGVLAILAVEAVLVLLLIRKLNRKNHSSQKALSSSGRNGNGDLDVRQSLDYVSKKEGSVWVLVPEKLAKVTTMNKVKKEQKKKKEIWEVSPVQKYAKITDGVLSLSGDSSESCTKILLKGCTVEAVSATSLSSKKWAKRYPIKVESKTSTLYKGTKIIYIYLDTCWEKESWCKALRVASCEDRDHLNSLVSLSRDFRSYLLCLNIGYPSLLKSSVEAYADIDDRDNRFDDSSSKVRIFLKKLAKKVSRNNDSKISPAVLSSREDRKFGQRAQSFQESMSASSISASSMAKLTAPSRVPSSLATEKMVRRSSSLSTHSNQSHITANSDADAEEKVSVDEGTLCWNLLLSRLFFDARRNADICTLIQARIQRTLSNLRTPSYMGVVSCTGVNPGDLPPCFLAMRALPTDLNEICAIEVDVMYSGGFILDIETRLEVRQLEDQKEANSVGEIPSDLLEEYLGEQMKLSGGMTDAAEEKGEKDSKTVGSKSSKGTWKSIINTVAQQVSQVPISLAIRIASLQGTLRLHIKPPPSDQLWFGFTSMPEIEFDLASSVGDHRITNTHLAIFLINRFKAVVRETLVLPNCESVCIPWMSAEKNDWVPRDVAPFIWLNQDTNASSSTPEVCSSHSGDHKTKRENIKESFGKLEEDISQNLKQDESVQEPNFESSDALTVIRIFPKPPSGSYQSLKELKTPLLKKDASSLNCRHSLKETTEHASSSSKSILTMGERNLSIEDDDSKTKRWGRRAKMLDLGKKMGEKLEEKRRTIEEKSRSIVEKMRTQGNG